MNILLYLCDDDCLGEIDFDTLEDADTMWMLFYSIGKEKFAEKLKLKGPDLLDKAFDGVINMVVPLVAGGITALVSGVALATLPISAVVVASTATVASSAIGYVAQFGMNFGKYVLKDSMSTTVAVTDTGNCFRELLRIVNPLECISRIHKHSNKRTEKIEMKTMTDLVELANGEMGVTKERKEAFEYVNEWKLTRKASGPVYQKFLEVIRLKLYRSHYEKFLKLCDQGYARDRDNELEEKTVVELRRRYRKLKSEMKERKAEGEPFSESVLRKKMDDVEAMVKKRLDAFPIRVFHPKNNDLDAPVPPEEVAKDETYWQKQGFLRGANYGSREMEGQEFMKEYSRIIKYANQGHWADFDEMADISDETTFFNEFMASRTKHKDNGDGKKEKEKEKEKDTENENDKEKKEKGDATAPAGSAGKAKKKRFYIFGGTSGNTHTRKHKRLSPVKTDALIN